MSFFSIFLALVIEQVRPLSGVHFLHNSLRKWATWVSRNVDAGHKTHGWLAWSVTVGVPSLLVLLVHWLLALTLGWVFAVAWNVALLYVTLGFRQFSHHFTDIRDALEEGNENLARELLAQWQQVDASALPRSEIVRHVIEHSVIDAHRHVFGVFFLVRGLVRDWAGPGRRSGLPVCRIHFPLLVNRFDPTPRLSYGQCVAHPSHRASLAKLGLAACSRHGIGLCHCGQF
jgi:adenosylcobinamide-phosphate synthase